MVDTIVSAPEGEQIRAAFRAHERGELALTAVWEIEAIAGELQRRFCAVCCQAEDMDLRAFSIRLEVLAGAIMSSIDDPKAETAHTLALLEGPQLTRDRQARMA